MDERGGRRSIDPSIHPSKDPTDLRPHVAAVDARVEALAYFEAARRGARASTFFVPLAVDEEHFDRAWPVFRREVRRLYAVVDGGDRPPPGPRLGAIPCRARLPRGLDVSDLPDDAPKALHVACLLVNDVVCSLAADASADDDEFGAVVNFCRAYHLLLALARKHPHLERLARNDMERFATHDTFRTKDATPDLGARPRGRTRARANSCLDACLRARAREREIARGDRRVTDQT